MTKELQEIITEISIILVREAQISSKEQMRMLELLRREDAHGEPARSDL